MTKNEHESRDKFVIRFDDSTSREALKAKAKSLRMSMNNYILLAIDEKALRDSKQEQPK